MISNAPENRLHLSFLDVNAARCYIQTLQMFPFPDDGLVEAASSALEKGLGVTLRKLPFLAGTIGPEQDQQDQLEATGRLALHYPSEIPSDLQKAGLFAAKTLDEFGTTYARLREGGMPMSALTAHAFCPDSLRKHPGVPRLADGLIHPYDQPVPVLAVQAFFIRGGLVLSIYVHHNVLDCSGMNSFWKHFAESVHNRRDSHDSVCPSLPDQSALRLQLDRNIPHIVDPIADAYTREKFTYEHTLPDDTPCSVKLFVIPAAKIRAYRDRLRESAPADVRLTICNVLAALVWIHVTRARAARLKAQGYEHSSNGIAVDLRKRMEPALGEDYMGCMALFAKPTLEIAHFTREARVSEETILPTALEINRTINKCDNDWVSRHLAFFKEKTPITDTEPALKFRFGPDIYITSWLNFGAEHIWNIPGASSERPEFIRRPTGPSDGGIIILPRRRAVIDGQEAPYEIMVRLATEDMTRLEEEDGGLRSWADRVVE